MGLKTVKKMIFNFIDSLSDGIVIFENDRIIDINRSLLDVIGGEKANYIDHHINGFLDEVVELKPCDNISQGAISSCFGFSFLIQYIITGFNDSFNMMIIKSIRRDSEDLNFENDLDEDGSVYKQILKEIADAVFILDDNERVIYANKASLSILNVENKENIIGRKLLDLISIHPQYNGIILRRREEILSGDVILPYLEQKLIRRDGSTVNAEISAISYTIKGKKRIMLIGRDITSRKLMEEKLVKSEGWHKDILEFLPDALFVSHNGKYVFVNSAGGRLLGVDDTNSLVDKEILNNLHPDYHTVREKRKKQLYSDKVQVPLVEQKIIRNDGSIIDVEVISAPFNFNGIEVVISMARDITRRKQAEEALKESDERYSKLVDMCPDGIFIVNNEEIVFANDSGAGILNLPDAKSAVGRKFLDFAFGNFKDMCIKRVKDIYMQDFHEKCTIEGKMITDDGVVKDIEIVNIDFNLEGKKLILNMVRDITERKRAEEDRRQLEEAREYDRLRTEFFSNISHELRTPLNIILSSLQLIGTMHNGGEECQYFKKFNNYYKMMKQNCYRLLRLINNLIDLTRLDAGFMNANLQNADIVSAVEDMVLSVAEYVKSKGITIIFDTEVEEKIIAFDPDKIERVMLNLLSNAIKFNREDGKIFVNMFERKDNIIISVKDTGIGIPENMQERIFERFMQVDNLFTRVAEGSGIGLSLVKSLIETQGGKVSVKSRVGSGSEFIIQLPITLVNDRTPDIIEDVFKDQDTKEKINIEFSDICS